MRRWRRREVLRLLGTGAAGTALGRFLPACGSDSPAVAPQGEAGLRHVLATASPDRLLLKASFADPQPVPPLLRSGRRLVAGRRTDSHGYFWAFDLTGLRPGQSYELEIVSAHGRTDPWPLRTLPAPDERPERLRILAYTCAGGNDIFPWYVPAPVRRRLLLRGLSFDPDVVVANGDHVYWDLRAGLAALVTGRSPLAMEFAGVFDRTAPVLGHENENVLRRAVDAQIAGLYGTLFRSVPVFFLRDDHDYFEDDQVTPELTTFPPDDFMMRLARATQWLYYPEFLPDPTRPRSLPGSAAPDRPSGLSEAFGTLRFGRLFEGLLYDCKGFLELSGSDAGLVPRAVERWLTDRLHRSDARVVAQFPSNPPGWTAGKFAEWYPDVLGPDGELTTSIRKPGWQAGWLAQHDRLLAAAVARGRLPLVASGDIHSIAEARIVRSGGLDFRHNPVVAVITGTPGTGSGWPSAARGTMAQSPAHLEAEVLVPVQEYNGFDLLDVEPDRVTIRKFRWRRGIDSEDAIDGLEPFHTSVHPV